MSNARVLDPTSPVAQVVDLSPGTYTFALTVVDTSYQSSTNKVLVRVLAGKCTLTCSNMVWKLFCFFN